MYPGGGVRILQPLHFRPTINNVNWLINCTLFV